jgi:hypothetical protein
MPLQKMTDALQMDPENMKRQDRLKKGEGREKARESAEAVAGRDKQGRATGVSADSTSMAAAAAVEEIFQRTDEAPTAGGHQDITSLNTGMSATRLGYHTLISCSSCHIPRARQHHRIDFY